MIGVTDLTLTAPDRPPPLSVKSRGSRTSSSTHVPNTVLRSVSTPIRIKPKGDLEPLLQGGLTVEPDEIESMTALSFAAGNSLSRSKGDVFSAAPSTNHNYHGDFVNKLQSTDDRRYGNCSTSMYRNSGDQALGPYQLDTSDLASESSYGTFADLVRKDRNPISTGTSLDRSIFGDESFDALESYIGSDDEDEDSFLESASKIGEEETQTQYLFAVQVPRPQSAIEDPVPSVSKHCTAAKVPRKLQASGLSSQAVNFHRALPLRSYESEAIMFPTAGAQAYSGRNRSKSVSSVVASRRPATEAMAVPRMTDSTETRNSLDEIEREFYERNSFYAKISEQVNQDSVSVSQCCSSASTLAAFPIPPMNNPVGQLPMLVSRAISSPRSLRTTASQHPLASVSLEDTYRAIITVAMEGVLQRTRVRGEGLRTVDWNMLTSFERAWREMNRFLLETIYGRNDVVLDEVDVTYIDRISQELRNESNSFESNVWVRRIFDDNA